MSFKELEIEIGISIDFVRRYYSMVDSFVESPQDSISLFDFVDYFEEKDFKARKHTAESFISLRETHQPKWGINVGTSHKRLEIIFVSPHYSFTFHGFAYEITEEKFPDLVREPPYPRISMPSEAELYKLAGEVHKLYTDLKLAMNHRLK